MHTIILKSILTLKLMARHQIKSQQSPEITKKIIKFLDNKSLADHADINK